MNNRRRLCFNWGISDHYGWGIYGFNLLLYGQQSESFQLVPLKGPSFLYPLDPLTLMFMTEGLPPPGAQVDLNSHDIVLSALGNQNQRVVQSQFRNIGVIFNETNPLPDEEIDILKEFEFVISGSTWNTSTLQERGITTKTIIQGIDTELFSPSPKRYLKDKFVIFSGGKLEYRKGQDILLKAFSILASRHKDVLLITAWRSPWEQQFSASVNQSNLCEPLQPSTDMARSIQDWIIRNGVKHEQSICLDALPNRLMPDVFREVDLAVFPNRCEGGTNLVAMEALSFGLPCLISKNTGHLDLIKAANCMPLVNQKPIPGNSTVDWGESSVDEMVDLMEEAYQGRAYVDRSVARNSMLCHSWENAIGSLLSLF